MVDVAIYVFAFIPIATTTIMGVYYGYIDTTGYYALALDYVVVCTVNLNGTLNCIAFVWFSSEKGKTKVMSPLLSAHIAHTHPQHRAASA